ncbi:MAG: glycine hydroxymethyltransferase [Parachlamydiales bacterium]|jgi:glycine hydroxymethyltransferase
MSRLESYLKKNPPEKNNKAAIAYIAALDHLEERSPIVANAILKELADERSHLKLIASENFSSLAVQLAMGNLMTDKYAEGHPGHRFYAGCENVDTLETLAQDQLKAIFDCEHAYVQPHSGADANLVAFWSILVQRVQNKSIEKLTAKSIDTLSPDEYETIRQEMLNQKVLGMSLNSGGHLTHGYRHNVSSKMMKALHYDVDPATEQLNYAQIREIAQREKPLILLAGYSAHTRRINFATMRTIADEIGAVLMVDMAHFSGLVAGKVFTGDENPIPYAHIVTSTTHKTLRGPRGGFVLCKEEFRDTVNKGCPLVLGGPLPHVIAAKAVAFQEANTPDFRFYAQRIVENARALAQSLQSKGVRIVSGGTDNHQVILDLSKFGLTGRQAEQAMRAAHITVNRNTIPFDKNGPWYTSGLRIGTPAMTTLGMGPREMEIIGELIYKVLANTKPALAKDGSVSKAQFILDQGILEEVSSEVKSLLRKFPLYPEIELENCV